MTTMQPTCDICGNPTDGYVCRRCVDGTTPYLRYVVDLAGEVETNVARLARYATRGGRRPAPVDDDEDLGPSPVNRRQPVPAFGWPASKDRPARGALRAVPMPVDLGASARASVAFNDVTTWARAVDGDRGTLAFEPLLRPLCALPRCGHDSCRTVRYETTAHPAAVAATYLLTQLDWIRHQRYAAEALEQMRAAGSVIRRIVDSPAARQVVGVCDCGAHLYAYDGADVVTCEDCTARWDVHKSRETLRESLRDQLTTAAEAAVLLVLFGLAANRDRCRKTIVMWGQRGRIQQRGQVDGDPVYRFGEVLDRASRVAEQAVAV